MNEDLDFIKIDLNQFKEKLKNLPDILPENLVKKSNDLLDNYNCFASNYDARSLWEKKKIIASKKTKDKSNFRKRPHLISFDFSDESKCKKEFISYLNKLTDLNKENIYIKIKIFLNSIDEKLIDSLFEILWTFIKISSNNIYIDVLYLFNKEDILRNINKYWTLFINNKEWLPPSYLLEHDKLFKPEFYDDYCKYTKWKKGSIALSRAWCIIFKNENLLTNIDNLIINIIENIEEYLIKPNHKHIVDLLLDQFNIYIDMRPNQDIITKIINWDLSKFESSSKFKLYNILDKYK